VDGPDLVKRASDSVVGRIFGDTCLLRLTVDIEGGSCGSAGQFDVSEDVESAVVNGLDTADGGR